MTKTRKEKMFGVASVPAGHRVIMINNRSPSGRWESDDILIVTEMDAIRLKMEYGDDCYDFTDLVNDTE